MLGDLNVAEPNARAGFAGPNIIEQTIRVKLPAGFQRSEFLLDHGAIDMIIHRKDMRDKVAALLAKFTNQPVPVADTVEAAVEKSVVESVVEKKATIDGAETERKQGVLDTSLKDSLSNGAEPESA